MSFQSRRQLSSQLRPKDLSSQRSLLTKSPHLNPPQTTDDVEWLWQKDDNSLSLISTQSTLKHPNLFFILVTVFLIFLGGGIAWHVTDVQSTSNNCCKSLPSGWGPQTHLDRWRILRRFFCNLRVRFFFHFQRNLERAWRHWMSFQQRGHSSREWRLKLKHLKFWKK